MQKCVKVYKDGGAKIFQKSQVNQPNQGHQPWQSNSLVPGGGKQRVRGAVFCAGVPLPARQTASLHTLSWEPNMYIIMCLFSFIVTLSYLIWLYLDLIWTLFCLILPYSRFP